MKKQTNRCKEKSNAGNGNQKSKFTPDKAIIRRQSKEKSYKFRSETFQSSYKPQKLGRPTLRYAGSPLKYSLSEAGHKKSAVLLELREKGDCRVELIPLRHLHDVREVEGMLSDVMKMDYSEDYVRVTVHDELVPPDARAAVSTVFPNMLKFAVVNSKTREERDVLASEMVEEKDVKELFSDFFRLQNNGVAPTEQQLALLDEVLKEMEEKRHEAD